MISSIWSAINHNIGSIALACNNVCNRSTSKILNFFNIETKIERIHKLKEIYPRLYDKIRLTEIGSIDIDDFFKTLSRRKSTDLRPEVILMPELFSLGHGALTDGCFIFIPEQELVEVGKSPAFIKFVLAHEWAHIYLKHHLKKFTIPFVNQLQNRNVNNVLNILSTYIIPNVTVYYLMQQLRDLIIEEHLYCEKIIETSIDDLWCDSIKYITNNPILLLGTSVVLPLLGRYMLAKLSSQYHVFMEKKADEIALDNLTNEELVECKAYLQQYNQYYTNWREELHHYFLPTHPTDQERMNHIDQILHERSKRT
ncbi:MAG: M48 family metalloprotease [Gammaproteobacteria bacterium]|jgi:hypothetical protein|nr:M48 family metalloprotease [Gammaproteobacteria bacterium]